MWGVGDRIHHRRNLKNKIYKETGRHGKSSAYIITRRLYLSFNSGVKLTVLPRQSNQTKLSLIFHLDRLVSNLDTVRPTILDEIQDFVSAVLSIVTRSSFLWLFFFMPKLKTHFSLRTLRTSTIQRRGFVPCQKRSLRGASTNKKFAGISLLNVK